MDPTPLPILLEALVSLLLIVGGLFALVGAIGLIRLRDFYMRLHAPTKASTLGLGGVLIGSMMYYGLVGGRVVIHELLVTLFVFMTAPISAHLMVRAFLSREPVRPVPAVDSTMPVPPAVVDTQALSPPPEPSDPAERR